MQRKRFRAVAHAAVSSLVVLGSMAGFGLHASAEQSPTPWWLATGADGTLYLVTDKGYYEVAAGNMTDELLSSLADLGPTSPLGPNGGFGPPAIAPAPEPAPAPPPVAPAPVAPGPPAPGTILYQADWSGGLTGWAGGPQWKTINGMLVNDGTTNGDMTTSFEAPVSDYAIEVEIQAVRLSQWPTFGIFLRQDIGAPDNKRYQVGFQGEPMAIAAGDSVLTSKGIAPGADWHRYRGEAKGNNIRLLKDGGLVLEVTDNRFLQGARLGLYDNGSQLNIRNFKVIAL